MHALEEELLIGGVKTLLAHHVFAVECPSLHRERRPEILAYVRRRFFRDHELQMVARIALVQRGGGELVAAMVAENAVLLIPRQSRIRHGHIEPSRTIAAVGAGAVVA